MRWMWTGGSKSSSICLLPFFDVTYTHTGTLSTYTRTHTQHVLSYSSFARASCIAMPLMILRSEAATPRWDNLVLNARCRRKRSCGLLHVVAVIHGLRTLRLRLGHPQQTRGITLRSKAKLLCKVSLSRLAFRRTFLCRCKRLTSLLHEIHIALLQHLQLLCSSFPLLSAHDRRG